MDDLYDEHPGGGSEKITPKYLWKYIYKWVYNLKQLIMNYFNNEATGLRMYVMGIIRL